MDVFLQNIGLIVGFIGGFASLIIIFKFLLGPIYTRLEHIENQVNNHLPTQIKELKENQKELKADIKALDQKIDKIADQTNQRFDQVNQRFDRLFEMLAKERQS